MPPQTLKARRRWACILIAGVLRTDQHGRVTLSTDGERLWVEVERAETAATP